MRAYKRLITQEYGAILDSNKKDKRKYVFNSYSKEFLEKSKSQSPIDWEPVIKELQDEQINEIIDNTHLPTD